MNKSNKRVDYKFLLLMLAFIPLIFFGYFSFVAEEGISVATGIILQILFFLLILGYFVIVVFIRKRYFFNMNCFYYFFASIFLTGLVFTILFLCFKSAGFSLYVFKPGIKGIISLLSIFVLFYVSIVI